MAVPGQITLNSLVAGIVSLTANYTNPTPGDTDKIFIQFKLSSITEWTTVEIFDNSTFTVWGLDGGVSYDCRLRAISNADGFGPWSNTLSQSPTVTTFGPPLVEWNDEGVNPGPTVTNTGTFGSPASNYDLDVAIINGGSLSNQVRNGRPVWQSSGGAGLRETNTPPPGISQPCTIYVAYIPFFTDGNFRWIVRGGFTDIEIEQNNSGFRATKNGQGIYSAGTIVTDGRLYVLEFVVNNAASTLRVLDDTGQDTGNISGNIGSSSSISPESVAFDFQATSGEEGPGQWMSIVVIDGIGTTLERNAVIEQLFQKFEFDAPDLIEYTTGDIDASAEDSTLEAEGSSPQTGDIDANAEPSTSVITGFSSTGGFFPGVAEDSFSTITGSVEVPPPFPIITPDAPNFLHIFRHLLPRARAWRLTLNKQIRQFFEGLSVTGDSIKECADLAFLDFFPATTRKLSDWFDQFGLTNPQLTEQEQRTKLDAAWKATGSLAPRYLQDVLQGQGFDVYVHEWWAPGSEPPIGTNFCVNPRNPNTYLRPTSDTASLLVECGELLAQCGEDFAQCGNILNLPGYPLVNKISKSVPDYIILCGEAIAQCGEDLAECGNYVDFLDVTQEYAIPSDPAKWPYFVYIGAATFPVQAEVAASRRNEFEELLLKYCPAHMWIGVIVTYT